MVSSQDLFAIEQGLLPVAPESAELQPNVHLPRPVPPQYPAGQDERRTYEQYYRPFWRTKSWDIDLSGNPAVGSRILPATQLDTEARFPFRALIVDNLSLFTFILQVGEVRVLIPGGVYNFVRPLPEGVNEINLIVNAQGTIDKCVFTFTEEPLAPNPGTGTSGGVASAVTVTNFPATQPVSGTVTVGGTVGISGTPTVSLGTLFTAGTPGAVQPQHLRQGTQGNLWNAAVTGAGGNSAVLNLAGTILGGTVFASIFGHVSAATTILLQASADNVNFYTVDSITLTAASDFGFTDRTIAASFIRLQSSASVTATATGQACT